MAKRKTPKVDKVVDLKPKAEKITDEQLQKLQKSVGNINRAKTELGALELQKHSIVKIIEEDDKYSIYIRKEKVVIPWKDFNKNMAISVEYNLEY